jgi:nitrate reductase gamma subunit
MSDFSENNKEVKSSIESSQQSSANDKSTQVKTPVKVAVYGCTFVVGIFFLLVSFFMFLLSGYMQDNPLLAYTFMFSPVLVIVGMISVVALISVGFSHASRPPTLKQPPENTANSNLPSENK